MNKSFWKLWLRDQLPLLITYLLLTGLVALLCYLYQLPIAIFTDLLRFSLPLLIVWLIATVLIAKRWQALLTRQLLRADFQPCSPVEEQLAAMLALSQRSYRQALQTVRQKQREQTDQRDLFAHEIKNHLAILRAQAEEQPQVPSKQVRAAVQQANYFLDLLLSGERLAMTNHDFHFQWLTLTKLASAIVQENAALFISKQLVPDILNLNHVQKTFDADTNHQVAALKDVNFSVDQGEYVAIMGESGAGKSTLLNIIATLDKATNGSAVLKGQDLGELGKDDAARFRREHLGFVFQRFNPP